jgi:hypothetical protein
MKFRKLIELLQGAQGAAEDGNGRRPCGTSCKTRTGVATPARGSKIVQNPCSRLENEGIKLGRDRFFDILRKKGLLVPPLPKNPVTTKFEPNLPVFHNLAAGLELTRPNQAWTADITYVRTDEGYLYLSLITDLWSRKIVGFNAGDSLETEGALSALAMAMALGTR